MALLGSAPEPAFFKTALLFPFQLFAAMQDRVEGAP
jgi:hypothetical protein